MFPHAVLFALILFASWLDILDLLILITAGPTITLVDLTKSLVSAIDSTVVEVLALALEGSVLLPASHCLLLQSFDLIIFLDQHLLGFSSYLSKVIHQFRELALEVFVLLG